MSDRQTGWFLRLVRGLWDTINFTRRLVLNAIFLLLLLIVVIALFSSKPKLKDRNTLVLAPQGSLVEQFSSDPAERALAGALGQAQPETRLRDLVRAIEAAASDDRIERMVIMPDDLAVAGFAGLHELAHAIGKFRQSGKPVVAYTDGLSQGQYFLAAQADEIHLHPEGAIILEGLSRYRAYYREALEDKLGVDVHLLRVGEYKSAGEPYILDGPSEEAMEADLYWMNDLWQRYVDEIAQLRGIEPAQLDRNINRFVDLVAEVDGDLAALAERMHLVDHLSTRDAFRARMLENAVPDDENEHTFRQVGVDEYLGFLGPEHTPFDRRAKVAIVVAQGEIVAGDQSPGTVGGESTSALVRQAREDKDVKALVLRVDSPGGGVFPSEQIRHEIELVKQAGKPVVISMGNVAASGGYWISMDGDRIYADPSTITGSIGIFGLLIRFPETLDKIGVHVGGAGTTSIAGAFDPSRPLEPEIEATIQTVIDRGYRQFIGKVAEARGRSIEQIDQVARGRVWSGAQAHELGLVDALGGLQDAVAEAARRAELEEDTYRVEYVEQPMTPFEQFMSQALGNAAAHALAARIGLPLEAWMESPAARDLRYGLDSLGPAQGPQPLPWRSVAHCMCEL